MNTITQITRRRQAIVEYSLKNGVTAAARRYNVSRTLIYRWKTDTTELLIPSKTDLTVLGAIQISIQRKKSPSSSVCGRKTNTQA